MVDMRLPVQDYLDQRVGLEYYVEARDKVFRNPTFENAVAFIPTPPSGWLDPSVPLAAVHKARLQWLDVTDAMIEESLQWLEEHGYSNGFKGIFPLTPESRDEQRAMQGKPPLAGKS